MTRSNLVLIGMPGAGKSTVGVVLAKILGLDFVDTDVLIQTRQEKRLQDIINAEGMEALGRIEAQTLIALDVDRTVIATGGSAVYSAQAMAALKRKGLVIFLDLPLATLTERLNDLESRGVVMAPGETLSELYRRRMPLYRQFADLTIEGQGKTAAQIALEISAATNDLPALTP